MRFKDEDGREYELIKIKREIVSPEISYIDHEVYALHPIIEPKKWEVGMITFMASNPNIGIDLGGSDYPKTISDDQAELIKEAVEELMDNILSPEQIAHNCDAMFKARKAMAKAVKLQKEES